eukprot:TRINITY_DN10593_c0_g1_i3.p1 TRINITY_DN10593_c0_g1~~TRINITY_DN10593_c0_g1_i3.p1  ORF type:complete len:371 (+),score=69.15 TRINITY_DN10593_c0_g1_i3:251-1363(+)
MRNINKSLIGFLRDAKDDDPGVEDMIKKLLEDENQLKLQAYLEMKLENDQANMRLASKKKDYTYVDPKNSEDFPEIYDEFPMMKKNAQTSDNQKSTKGKEQNVFLTSSNGWESSLNRALGLKNADEFLHLKRIFSHVPENIIIQSFKTLNESYEETQKFLTIFYKEPTHNITSKANQTGPKKNTPPKTSPTSSPNKSKVEQGKISKPKTSYCRHVSSVYGKMYISLKNYGKHAEAEKIKHLIQKNESEGLQWLKDEQELFFNNLKKNPSVCKVDLHGYYVDEALHYVEQVLFRLRQWISDGVITDYDSKANVVKKKGCKYYQINLITGKGNHSAGGIAKLYPNIKQYLEEKKILHNGFFEHGQIRVYLPF